MSKQRWWLLPGIPSGRSSIRSEPGRNPAQEARQVVQNGDQGGGGFEGRLGHPGLPRTSSRSPSVLSLSRSLPSEAKAIFHPETQSVRSASRGSTEAARRAGRALATRADSSNDAAGNPRDTGSIVPTLYSLALSSLATSTAIGSPRSRPRRISPWGVVE